MSASVCVIVLVSVFTLCAYTVYAFVEFSENLSCPLNCDCFLSFDVCILH